MNHLNTGYYKYRCRDGVILAVNQGFIRILELDMKERDITGRSLSEFLIYVDDNEDIREQLKPTGELRNYEYHFKTLKGKDKCVLYNSYIEKDAFTGEEVIEALVQDITEEKLSYEKMRESQERYEKLFKNSGDIVIVCEMDNFIIEEVNPIMEIVTEFSERELIGIPLGKLIDSSHQKRLKEVREDLLFKGTARLETIIQCKNGDRKEVIITLSTVEIEDYEIVLAIVKDVSELIREKQEQELRKKELESFWKASVEREERIRDLRIEIEKAQRQIKVLKEEYGQGLPKD